MESISTSIHRLKDYLINDVPRSICSQSLLVLKIDIGDGKSFTIYKGLLTDLENNSDTFVNLLEPSSAYRFTMKCSSQYDKRLTWLTDPDGPEVVEVTATSAEIKWNRIQLGPGVQPSEFENAEYILQMIQGRPVESNKSCQSHPYRPDDELFNVLCKGPRLKQAHVKSLTPNTWYHFRLKIKTLDRTVVSRSTAVATDPAPPNRPSPPHAELLHEKRCMSGRAMISSAGSVVSVSTSATLLTGNNQRIKIVWYPVNDNGRCIECFKLQQLVEQSSERSSFKESNNDLGMWQDVCTQTQLSTTIDAPINSFLRIKFRVAARNSIGWSPYSEECVLSANGATMLQNSLLSSSSSVETILVRGDTANNLLPRALAMESGLYSIRETSAFDKYHQQSPRNVWLSPIDNPKKANDDTPPKTIDSGKHMNQMISGWARSNTMIHKILKKRSSPSNSRPNSRSSRPTSVSPTNSRSSSRRNSRELSHLMEEAEGFTSRLDDEALRPSKSPAGMRMLTLLAASSDGEYHQEHAVVVEEAERILHSMTYPINLEAIVKCMADMMEGFENQ